MSQTNLLDVVKLHTTLFCAIGCYIRIWETMRVPGHDLRDQDGIQGYYTFGKGQGL